MTVEFWGTIASAGTFFVIAATAIAAIVQLHHMRGGNQIAALTECRETLESEEFVAARRFVTFDLPAKLKDPEVLKRLERVPLDDELQSINTIANFFESMGSFVRHRIIDREIACDLWAGVVIQSWNRLAPVIPIARRTSGPALWENFEYMAVLSQDWVARHPAGSYPKGMRRITLADDTTNARP